MCRIPECFELAALKGTLPIDETTGQLGLYLIINGDQALRIKLATQDVAMLRHVLSRAQTEALDGTNSHSENDSGISKSAGQTPLDGINVLPPTSSSKATSGEW